MLRVVTNWLAVLSFVALGNVIASEAYHCEQTRSGLRCYGDDRTESYQNSGSAWRFGVDAGFHSWFYDDGPANLFAGPGVNVEYASQWWAVHTAYQFNFLLNSTEPYALSSGQVQVHLGPTLSEPGLSPFVIAGGFLNSLHTPLGNNELLSGWLTGAGIQLDFGKNAIAFQATWQSDQALKQLWQDVGSPAQQILPLHSKVSLKSRF